MAAVLTIRFYVKIYSNEYAAHKEWPENYRLDDTPFILPIIFCRFNERGGDFSENLSLLNIFAEIH